MRERRYPAFPPHYTTGGHKSRQPKFQWHSFTKAPNSKAISDGWDMLISSTLELYKLMQIDSKIKHFSAGAQQGWKGYAWYFLNSRSIFRGGSQKFYCVIQTQQVKQELNMSSSMKKLLHNALASAPSLVEGYNAAQSSEYSKQQAKQGHKIMHHMRWIVRKWFLVHWKVLTFPKTRRPCRFCIFCNRLSRFVC